MTDTIEKNNTDTAELNDTETVIVDTPPLEEEIAKFKDLWMRAAADADNLRKRSAKDREDTLKYAVTKFAQDMVAIADNLARAVETCPSTIPSEVSGVVDGIKLVQDELRRIFERHGIQEIHPLGALFDPNFHQAMFEIPATETLPSGTVGQVLQAGYMIHDRLLRPALVGVTK
jgi:molecular chaperone GrpE